MSLPNSRRDDFRRVSTVFRILAMPWQAARLADNGSLCIRSFGLSAPSVAVAIAVGNGLSGDLAATGLTDRVCKC